MLKGAPRPCHQLDFFAAVIDQMNEGDSAAGQILYQLHGTLHKHPFITILCKLGQLQQRLSAARLLP